MDVDGIRQPHQLRKARIQRRDLNLNSKAGKVGTQLFKWRGNATLFCLLQYFANIYQLLRALLHPWRSPSCLHGANEDLGAIPCANVSVEVCAEFVARPETRVLDDTLFQSVLAKEQRAKFAA